MDDLLNGLREVYFNDDPRLNGENPKCTEIWDEMVEQLSQLEEEQLISILQSLPEEDLEIIYPVIEDLMENGANVEKFIR